MNELEIRVTQQPGVISTNFTEVKEALAVQMQVYKELEVTEANKPERKKDIATLRKMQKAIAEKKSEVRNKCLEPYTEFNKLADELTQIIEEPIGIIDNQVKEFEEKQRLRKIEDIKTLFCELIGACSTDMQNEIGIEAIYDNRWENATASMKSVKDEMTAKLKTINDNVALIKSMVSDKTEEALRLFWGDLDVTKAVTVINRYEAQKREIQARMEAEQKAKIQAELEAEKERVRKEERDRIETERCIREEEQNKAAEKTERILEEERQKLASKEESIRDEERIATEKRLLGIKEPSPVIETLPVDLEAPFTEEDEAPFIVPGQGEIKAVFTVTGTETELQQVEMYLNSIGLIYERKDE